MSTVQTLQDTIAGVADSVGPSVVGLGRGWGHGSGVVIADGQILTSAHNLRREEVTVSFHDGRRERAELVGSDADLDLAVLAVDTGDAPAVRRASCQPRVACRNRPATHLFTVSPQAARRDHSRRTDSHVDRSGPRSRREE